jgi:hypothetical protein
VGLIGVLLKIKGMYPSQSEYFFVPSFLRGLVLLFSMPPKHAQGFFDDFVFRLTLRIGFFEQGMPAHSREFFWFLIEMTSKLFR